MFFVPFFRHTSMRNSIIYNTPPRALRGTRGKPKTTTSLLYVPIFEKVVAKIKFKKNLSKQNNRFSYIKSSNSTALVRFFFYFRYFGKNVGVVEFVLLNRAPLHHPHKKQRC